MKTKIAITGFKTQALIAKSYDVERVLDISEFRESIRLLKQVDAELWGLYHYYDISDRKRLRGAPPLKEDPRLISRPSKAQELDYLAVLEVIYAGMLRAEQAAWQAADAHMQRFVKNMQDEIGIFPNIVEEPYLEAEVKRFELQLLKTLERLAERMEKHFHGEKSLEIEVVFCCGNDVYSDYKKIDPTQPILEQVEKQVAYEEWHMQGRISRRLDYYRQQQVGFTHYIWRSQDDERVRSRHAFYDDEVFAWDNPPADGHPGEAFNCRCYAEPSKQHMGEPKIAFVPLIVGGALILTAEESAIILAAMSVAILTQRERVNLPSVFSPDFEEEEGEEETTPDTETSPTSPNPERVGGFQKLF